MRHVESFANSDTCISTRDCKSCSTCAYRSLSMPSISTIITFCCKSSPKSMKMTKTDHELTVVAHLLPVNSNTSVYRGLATSPTLIRQPFMLCKTVLTNKQYLPILVSVIPLLANIRSIHRYLAILADITVFWNLVMVSLSVLVSF
jgi:hypothetical protein